MTWAMYSGRLGDCANEMLSDEINSLINLKKRLLPDIYCQPSLSGAWADVMAYTNGTVKQASFGDTMRRDAWWLQPAVVFVGLSLFVVYSTWAALQGEHYYFGPYLSPFYSLEIFGASTHSLFG